MIDIKLPFWLNANETNALINAAKTWWARVEEWLQWPIRQFDALTCTTDVLSLLAWQRDISRFENEPTNLFRKRVAFALINAQQAGQRAGFKAIFARLNISLLEQHERFDNVNWDVIQLLFKDGDLSGKEDLFNFLVRQYGRTCRRYEFAVVDETPPILIMCNEFNVDFNTTKLSIAELQLNDVFNVQISNADFNLNQATDKVALTL